MGRLSLVAICLVALMTLAIVVGGVDATRSRSRSQRGGMALENGNGRVRLTYFVETHCARCIDVVTHSLVDAIARVGDIVDLEIVPFGNGDVRGNTVTCQHGEAECHGNKLQSCAMKYYPKRDQWFSFIVCMEKANDPLQAAQSCAEQNKLDWSKLEPCATGAEGHELLLANGHRTLNLAPPNGPPHMPWILVNDRSFQDAENIVAAVCSQYTQPDKAVRCANTARYAP